MRLEQKIIIFIIFIGLFNSCIGQNFDINLLHSINSGNSTSWDNTNKVFTRSVTPIMIATPTSLWLYGVLAHDSAAKRNALMIAAGMTAAGIISTSLKYGVNRTRPFVTYPFIMKKTEAGSPSFPSGHTSAAFATATSLSLYYPKWYVIVPSFLWAGAVSYSRMELGVHYPSDVLAGAIIGAGSSWLMWKANKWIANKKRK